MTHRGRTARNAVAAVAVMLMMTAFSMAQYSETPVYTFTGSKDGALPGNQFVSDSAGNLYGTTDAGGNQSTSCALNTGELGCGVVFKLSPGANGTWTETVLHTFTGGKDGALPYGGVILDSAGNLYGTTYDGGDEKPKVCQAGSNYPAGCGVVYELTPTAHGPWKETVLYTFTGGKDGAFPWGSVVFDGSGNLYGASQEGGVDSCNPPYGCGVVFKLTPTKQGPWNETVLYTFDNVGAGLIPVGGVTFDSGGNLYGVTFNGGDKSVECYGVTGCGVVFKLTPTAHGPWKESVPHAFTGGRDGGYPQGTPLVNQNGNIYGTTVFGGDTERSKSTCDRNERGNPLGCGVVYELTPGANGAWKYTVLYRFIGDKDGSLARSPVIFDSARNLYSQTVNGGDPSCNNGYGCGVVFELTPTANPPWTETVLYAFTLGKDGGIGQSNLLLDSAGDIFGMVDGGGDDSECPGNHLADYGCGVVFELTP